MKQVKRRLFFAFELPGRAVQTIESLQHDLQRKLRGPLIKWTSPDSWHITTHFVGEVDDVVANNLADAMSLIPTDAVSFSPWALDIYPSKERPRYIVLKLADPSASGFKMHQAHFPILLQENVAVDTQPWSPHIALGKIQTGRNGFSPNLSEFHIPQETFTVPKLTLFETKRNHDVRYHPIECRNLPR